METVSLTAPIRTSRPLSGRQSRESGCWEVLANQAVASRQAQCEHAISEPELRLVRDRLWWMLDQLKQQLDD